MFEANNKTMQKVNWNRQKITKRAWQLRKEGKSWKEAMQIAWHEEKVYQLLYLLPRCKEVHFSFNKVNGTVREAVGTTFVPMLQQYNSVPQGYAGNHNRETNKPFMDVEKAKRGVKNSWSSLVLTNLISVKGVEYV